jgi:phosphate transport system substrate-binding protein
MRGSGLKIGLFGLIAISAAPVRADVDQVLASLPHYAPREVPMPGDSKYLGSDGSISIVGYADMQQMLGALGRIFAAVHSGFRFRIVGAETYAAPLALASGVSALAPMGAEFDDVDVVAYRRLVGSYPMAFHIAHDPATPEAKSGPMGIFVHPANPLESVTTAQVAEIFSRGSAGGEIVSWGELGLSATDWSNRKIEPCGTSFDVGIGAFMQAQFGGRPPAAHFLPITQSEDVIRYVASHPGAIGYAKLNNATAQVKLLAIADGRNGGPSRATADDLMNGKYPYDRMLLLYARQPLEPWVREFLRLVFSREGQEAIATSPPHYLPVNPGEARRELAQLDR